MQDYKEPIEKDTSSEGEGTQSEAGPEKISAEPTIEQIPSGTVEVDKEKLRELPRKKLEKVFPSQAPITPKPPQAQVVSDVAQIKDLSQDRQIAALVDLAFTKGIDHAVDVVRNLDNAYLVDAFHDTLIDKLKEKLISKGKLEQL